MCRKWLKDVEYKTTRYILQYFTPFLVYDIHWMHVSCMCTEKPFFLLLHWMTETSWDGACFKNTTVPFNSNLSVHVIHIDVTLRWGELQKELSHFDLFILQFLSSSSTSRWLLSISWINIHLLSIDENDYPSMKLAKYFFYVCCFFFSCFFCRIQFAFLFRCTLSLPIWNHLISYIDTNTRAHTHTKHKFFEKIFETWAPSPSRTMTSLNNIVQFAGCDI